MTGNRPATCRHSNMLAVEVPWGCNMAPWLYQYHTVVGRFSNFGMTHRWRWYKISKLLDSTWVPPYENLWRCALGVPANLSPGLGPHTKHNCRTTALAVNPSPSQDCNHCCVADGAGDGGSGLVGQVLAATAACCIDSFFSKSLVPIPLGSKAKLKPRLHTLNMEEGKSG